MSESEPKQVFECILQAKTTVGIRQGQASMTYLDHSIPYQMNLKKLNEKLFNDQLFVSIRFELCLNEEQTHDQLEANLLDKWIHFHPEERLFNIKSTDCDAVSDMRQSHDRINVASFTWAPPHAKSPQNGQNQEIQLTIQFNCVSSQFPIKHNSIPVDSSFLLFVEIVSQNTCVVLESVCCQVKLFWPGGADRANHIDYLNRLQRGNKALFKSNMPESETFQYDYIPSCEYTKLIALTPESINPAQFYLALPGDYFEDFDSNKHESETISNPQSSRDDQKTPILYILHEMPTYQSVQKTKRGDSFEGFFMEVEKSFKIELKSQNDQVLRNKVIRVLLELNLKDSQFSEIDLITWRLNNENGNMLQLDYTQSILSDHIFDIRRIDTNLLEIIYLVKSDESQIFAVQVNVLSSDFSKTILGQNNEIPFQFKLCPTVKRTSINLGRVFQSIFTAKSGEAERQMQKWLELSLTHQNKPNSANVNSNKNRSNKIILNKLTVPSNSTQMRRHLHHSARRVVWHVVQSCARLLSAIIAKHLYEFMTKAYQDGRWFECLGGLLAATLIFWLFIWN